MSIGWHAQEALDVRITNRYNVRLGIGGFTLGALLDGTRTGNDGIVGTLVWNEDKDTYEGTVNAWARGTQKITSTLTGSFQCPSAESHGWQELDVVGTKIPAFGPAHKLSDYSWTSGDHGGGYVSLEFFVATPPRYLKRDRCQTNIGGWTSEASGHTPAWLLPFNDAQWTVEHAGYGIALPNKKACLRRQHLEVCPHRQRPDGPRWRAGGVALVRPGGSGEATR